MEDPYSIKNCVSTLEGMAEELLMEEMIRQQIFSKTIHQPGKCFSHLLVTSFN
jgi:hypothetical protein